MTPNLYNDKMISIKQAVLSCGIAAVSNEELTEMIVRPVVRRGVGPAIEYEQTAECAVCPGPKCSSLSFNFDEGKSE